MKCSHCGDDAFPRRNGTDGKEFCIDSEACEQRKVGRDLMLSIHAAIGTAIAGFAHELAEEFRRTYLLRIETADALDMQYSYSVDANVIAEVIDRALRKFATDPDNPYKLPKS